MLRHIMAVVLRLETESSITAGEVSSVLEK